MVSLGHGWIEPGDYPLGEVSELKWENTQEFHDRLIELQSDVQHAINVAQDKVNQANQLVGKDQRLKRPLYQWADDDYIGYIYTCRLLHGLSETEIKDRIKQLIIRDRNQSIRIALQKRLDDDQNEPVKFVDASVKIKNIIDKLDRSTVMIDLGINKFSSFERLRFISKSMMHVNSLHKNSVNLDAKIENIIAAKSSNDDLNGAESAKGEHNHVKPE